MTLRSLFPVAMFVVVFQSQAQGLRLSQPVFTDQSTETFGVQLNESLTQVTLSELVQQPDAHMGKAFLLETRIAKVCQKKGCFFIAQEGKDALRVAFRDYGFFIPTDSSNKVVRLSGELVEKEMTEAKRDHFVKDLGEAEEALQAGKVFEIVADSVRIPKE